MSYEMPDPLVATEQLGSIDDLDVIGGGANANNYYLRRQNMGSRTLPLFFLLRNFLNYL